MLKKGEGESGITYQASRAVICKTRPLTSILENVPEAAQDDIREDDDLELDPGVVRTIKDDMENAKFSVLFPSDDAVSRGSLCVRNRIYPCVIAIRPRIFEQFRGPERFTMVFSALKVPQPYGYECFALPPEVLQQYCAPLEHGENIAPIKKRKEGSEKNDGIGYRETHEALFSFCKVPWPVDVSLYLPTLRPRENEVMVLANQMFPAERTPEDKQLTIIEFF